MIKLFALLTGCVLSGMACSSTPVDRGPASVARFFLETDARQAGTIMTLPQSEVRVTVAPKPVITEYDVIDVQVVQVELGKCLRFELTSSAARDVYRLTASHQGRRLVVAVDGKAMGARRIDRPFADGEVLIFVERPDEALPDLAKQLSRTAANLQRVARSQ